LEDTVEFFNLILGTRLAPLKKQDLVPFLANGFTVCKVPGWRNRAGS
jgi:hypothetical protein